MDIPRILLAAGASGSGKTLITCGLLQALVNRKMKVASFKCGPDYIDPMFHSRVIGTKSRNLDTFFTDAETTRYLLGKNAADCDIAVMEGVMAIMTAWVEYPRKQAPMTWQIPQILRSSLW